MPGIYRFLKGLALFANGLLMVGIAYKAVEYPPEWTDYRGWLQLTAIIACPLLNALGLLRARGLVTTVLALLYNGCIICLWAFLIFLMMVWPMGSKPEGFELFTVWASLAVLILTEAVLVRLLFQKKESNH